MRGKFGQVLILAALTELRNQREVVVIHRSQVRGNLLTLLFGQGRAAEARQRLSDLSRMSDDDRSDDPWS